MKKSKKIEKTPSFFLPFFMVNPLLASARRSSRESLPPSARADRLRSARLLFLDHRRDVREQFLRVVDDAVLDRPLDAADALGDAGLIVQSHRAVGIEHFEVL